MESLKVTTREMSASSLKPEFNDHYIAFVVVRSFELGLVTGDGNE